METVGSIESNDQDEAGDDERIHDVLVGTY